MKFMFQNLENISISFLLNLKKKKKRKISNQSNNQYFVYSFLYCSKNWLNVPLN